MVAVARTDCSPTEIALRVHSPRADASALEVESLRARSLWLAVLIDCYLSVCWMEVADPSQWARSRGSGPKSALVVRQGRWKEPLATHPFYAAAWAEWRERRAQHERDRRWALDRHGGCPEMCALAGVDYEAFRAAVIAGCPENDGRWPRSDRCP